MNANYKNRLKKNPYRSGVLLSVIIPAYNAEKTLRRAVESALSAAAVLEEDAVIRAGREEGQQPLCEILVVENGSEDGTAALAAALAREKGASVRVLHSDRGVSRARNLGLDHARGSWVLFLDADDYFLPDAGRILRDDMHFTGTDLVVHSYESGTKPVHLCEGAGERYARKEKGPENSGSGSAPASSGTIEDISVRMIENPTRYTSVWSKLFRRERIEYKKLRFDPSLRLSEDSHFLIRYLGFCRRIRLVDRIFYHYSTDNASAVRTWDGAKEEGYKRSLLAVGDYLRTQPDRVRAAVAGYGMMQFNLLMVREVFAAANPMPLPEKIRLMRRISAEEPFASCLAGYDPARHRGARYLPFLMLRGGMAAGAAAIYEARVLQNARKEKMH